MRMKKRKRQQYLQSQKIGEPIEANMGTSKIIARNIYKEFADKRKKTVALHNVTVEIQDNDFVCIVGPSGCGKSTLLRIMAGLDFPTKGEIVVNDRVVHGPGSDRGMVFQSYTLFPWMTVEENIQYGLKLRKLPKQEIKAISNSYLEKIHLTDFRNSYPKELSGGMKQRVAIARALANRPEVLLMDEPFGALDPHTKEQMQFMLREIWQVEKPTIVFITHDIEEAVFMSNKIYIMSAGPGEIKKEVGIYFPYHRKPELKDSEEFIALRKEINYLLYEDKIKEGAIIR